MSNDIRPEWLSRVNVKSVNSDNSLFKTCANNECKNEEKDASGAMDVLGAQGCAQVNMDNPHLNRSVKNSMETLKNDPETVKNYVDFCDGLVEKGYPLEKSLAYTDTVFNALKTQDTYQ